MSREEKYLRIAKILGAHGLKGHLKIYLISDILERFNIGNTVFIADESRYDKYVVTVFYHQKARQYVLGLENIEDRARALAVKGKEIFIPESQATAQILDEDSYYYRDLIGCDVYRDGCFFGKIIEIHDTGATDLLAILDDDGKKYLIPFVDEIVDTSEISKGIVKIFPIEGLLENY